MALGKSAKVLSPKQVQVALSYLDTTRHPVRNKVIFLLSIKAGLRAKEISCLKWHMMTASDGTLDDVIRLEDIASKGKSGRVIPINKLLREALQALMDSTFSRGEDVPEFVITTERSDRTSSAAIANMFQSWYKDLGFQGCSSHSGRRTFITQAARQISLVGGSLKDVQVLAGHCNLATTQLYIQGHEEAQRKIVDLI